MSGVFKPILQDGVRSWSPGEVVAGKANNEPHSWNIVEVDEMFYFLDTTWDSEKNSYSYFLKGKQSFDDHKAEFFNGNDCINGNLILNIE